MLGYFFSIIFFNSLTVLLVGMLKYLSSSELILLTNGSIILLYGSIIIETTYSMLSSQTFCSNHKYILLKGYLALKLKLFSMKSINFLIFFNNDLILFC